MTDLKMYVWKTHKTDCHASWVNRQLWRGLQIAFITVFHELTWLYFWQDYASYTNRQLFIHWVLHYSLVCVMTDFEMCAWETQNTDWHVSLVNGQLYWILKITFIIVLERKLLLLEVKKGTMETVTYRVGWETSEHLHWLMQINYLNYHILTCDVDIWVCRDTFDIVIRKCQMRIITYVSVSTRGRWLKTWRDRADYP